MPACVDGARWIWARVEATHDRFSGLRRIGIDEISYKRGHKYLMVVVDHDTRRLIWAAPGRNSATVREFFVLLGADRCAQITHVSADGADFIDSIVAEACPDAVRVADPFHVVKWATEALKRWISWARRCRIPAFVKLQKSIVKHRSRILPAIEHNLSTGSSNQPTPRAG
ncbi:hypothetical protein BH09ACT10_BH09ACT10_30140 [soil metagenome]